MLKVVISSVSEYLRYVEIERHLSRQKMLVKTLIAMIKSRSVVLSELAFHLNDSVKTSSNETRLQDFYREVSFDYEATARFLYSFLQAKTGEKIRLSIDRTEWDFGEQQTNILMVIATKGCYCVPLYWEMLDNNSGNSSTNDRIDVIQKCIDLIGAQNIGLLVGDREFIGHKWFKYLKDKQICFCFRIPKSHLIETEDGKIHRADALWQKSKQTATGKLEFHNCLVDNVWVAASISTDAKGELLFLCGTAKAKFLDQLYRKRWTIETLFHAFKSRGFNLEQTHLKHNHRLKKLVAMVSLAFAFCISLGIFKHEKDKPIKTKKHKRKAKSFFRYGLDFLRDAFKVDFKYQESWLDIFIQFIKHLFLNNSFSTT